MKKKKLMMVSINGNKTKTYRKNSEANRSHYLQPMSMDQRDFDDSRKGDSNHTLNVGKKKSGHQNSFKRFKPLLFAIISAIVIGSALGFLMLIMFKGIGNDPSTESAPVSMNTNKESEEKSKEDVSSKQTTSAEAMNAYVLQSGVFSEAENADQWGKSYTDAGFPIVIWENDNQYYLFTGISASKDVGESYADELLELDFDVYLKDWHTESKEMQLSENENEWILSFQGLWNETLQSISDGKSFTNEKWNKLLDEKTLETEALISFQEELKKRLLEDKINNNSFSQQHFLLRIWYEFDLTMKDI